MEGMWGATEPRTEHLRLPSPWQVGAEVASVPREGGLLVQLGEGRRRAEGPRVTATHLLHGPCV